MRSHAHRDARELPGYTIQEASRYLNLPPSTVRWWSVGRDSYPGLIKPAKIDGRLVLLSFFNLVELHVLGVIRRDHKVRMPKVRSALDYLSKQLHTGPHPLITQEMLTDGLDLFVEHLDELINASRRGQQGLKEVLQAALRRVDRDPDGLPVRLYPFTRSSGFNVPHIVVIDAAVSGGRPTIKGTGLATEVIAERYKAGESVHELARDYGRKEKEIEEAIRCELRAAA